MRQYELDVVTSQLLSPCLPPASTPHAPLMSPAFTLPCRKQLHETLARGTTVVCDRYVYSGVAFTSAKPGFEGSQSLAWCRAPDAGLPQPDAIVYLTLSPDAAEKRGGFGEERYETSELQASVRRRFAEVRRSDEEAGALGADGKGLWRVVDAEGTVEEVEARVLAAVDGAIQGARQGKAPSPEKLWA